MGDRLRFVRVSGSGDHQSFCAAVDEGLSATEPFLPTRFLYDQRGSELFEQITELPEYYLTGCEAQIFFKYAAEIAACMPNRSSLVEFGSGSSKKTRLLLEAMLWRQGSLTYHPIDISEDFLRANSEQLLAEYKDLSVQAVSGEYFDVAAALPGDSPRLILFLGSNIGNLEHEQALRFLSLLCGQMQVEDRLLVGVDLAKEADIIEAAYSDSKGITAAFNKNMLARVNRELDGNFDLEAWCHEAPYDPAERRVEMKLIAEGDQRVVLDAIGKTYQFAAGQAIHTEWSHKYTLETFGAMAAGAGLEVRQVWLDDREWFASILLWRSERQ